MASYHQFCPVAKAMELLDQRWTLLLVRELIAGSERFNDLRRGLPRMSPTLLSQRLTQLTRAGLIERIGEGAATRYVLSPAGMELRPIVEALGAWGVRWIGELGEEDLDPQLLMWDVRRNVDYGAVPATRTVVHFHFTDVSPARYWLVIDREDADICDYDPGHPVAVAVTTTLRELVGVWRGDRTWAEALRSGDIALEGSRTACRALPTWFTFRFAAVPRPAAPMMAPA